jgi:hypothetical protein
MDAGPFALTRHLKCYAHLFIKDGREGEPIASFHISKTTDLTPASDLILIPHRPASQSPERSRQTMTTRRETLSQATVESTKPPTEEDKPPNLTSQSKLDDTPDQQDWWDDADVSGLIDPKAFRRFLYGCDRLLENSNLDRDDDEVALPMAGSDTGPSSDEEPKLGQSSLARG